MSWSITLIENTAVVPEDRQEGAALVVVASADTFQDYEDSSSTDMRAAVFYKGKLNFNSDDMEHMDYVTMDDAICKAMAAAGTTGRILFGSLEGDNTGSFWGVEFASGHYRRMNAGLADINWKIGTSIPG